MSPRCRGDPLVNVAGRLTGRVLSVAVLLAALATVAIELRHYTSAGKWLRPSEEAQPQYAGLLERDGASTMLVLLARVVFRRHAKLHTVDVAVHGQRLGGRGSASSVDEPPAARC
jgi:hypothetical protein